MSGAEIDGQLPPALVQVDRDDGRGFAHHGRQHRGQADRPRAGDYHRRSGLDVKRVHHRAGPGLDAASERPHEFDRGTRW